MNQQTADSKKTPKRSGRKAAGEIAAVDAGQSADLAALQNIQAAESESLQPEYSLIRSGSRAGVWFKDVGIAKDGTPYYKPPQRLCDPLEIIGRGRNLDGNEYRVLQYRQSGSRETVQTAMPLEIVGTREGWAFLRALGICVTQNGATQAHLANYLQWEGDKTEWQIISRGGWTDKRCTAYVLPSGEIIGDSGGKVIYIGDSGKREAFEVSGSLQEWQEQIGRYAVCSSRIILAIGTALAAPLLAIVKQENGGFHFFGSSSVGKSISGMVAASLIGNPQGVKVQWKGTSLGFDNEAAANNDGLIFMDEISEADPKTAKEVGYSIFNGVSKLQGAKHGGNRTRQQWRILAISTGEFSAEHYLKAAGFEWNAGQAVRLPAIPADAGKGWGVFDSLGGFDTSRALAQHLEQAAKTYYGAPFRAFVAEVAKQMQSDPAAFTARLNELRAEFIRQLPALESQPARAAQRFALAAAALSLACEWKIMPFDSVAGLYGMMYCFRAWYERDGQGNYEQQQIIQAMRDLLQRDGMGERFVSLDGIFSGNYETARNHAGFRFPPTADNSRPRWFVTDEVFRTEICNGKDPRFVARTLAEIGWLKTDGKNYKIKLPAAAAKANGVAARMYCFAGDIPPAEYEADKN